MAPAVSILILNYMMLDAQIQGKPALPAIPSC